jgi:dTDP-4-dehydrorhamnose reductase
MHETRLMHYFFILENKKKFGIYHLTNEGKLSYLKFVKEIKKMLKSKSKIISVKDDSFLSLGFKPLKTSLKSKKIKLRNWKMALSDYIKDN